LEQAMAVPTEAALSALAPLVGAGVRPAGDADAVMGVRPAVVVEPADEDEIAAVLAWAHRAAATVLVRGGGTQLGMGAPPSAGDIVLSMARLNAQLEHAPHDQTTTVQAGMRLVDVQAVLAETNQWLALDPVLRPEATIGGVIATNASGARRLRYGGVRDALIGIRVVLADGTIAKGGGKVVKNVAGYDLPKLFVGSLGTLGVIVAATFRLYPLPVASRTIVCASPDLALAPLATLIARVRASTLVPTSIDLASAAGSPGAELAIRFESGVAPAVDDQAATVARLVGECGLEVTQDLTGADERRFWQALDGALEASAAESAALTVKASLLPAQVVRWLGELAGLAAATSVAARFRAHAGHGIVYARLTGTADALASAVDRLRAAASAGRGSLVVSDAPSELAARLDVWGPVAALDVMRRIKERFDPNATLNPGRFVGGL
jgi:glycolate oxidase FAD binding subunit